MLGFEKCDECRCVRYGKDGGSTYCGKRNGRCEFKPKREVTKRCPKCGATMPDHWAKCPWCGFDFAKGE